MNEGAQQQCNNNRSGGWRAARDERQHVVIHWRERERRVLSSLSPPFQRKETSVMFLSSCPFFPPTYTHMSNSDNATTASNSLFQPHQFLSMRHFPANHRLIFRLLGVSSSFSENRLPSLYFLSASDLSMGSGKIRRHWCRLVCSWKKTDLVKDGKSWNLEAVAEVLRFSEFEVGSTH